MSRFLILCVALGAALGAAPSIAQQAAPDSPAALTPALAAQVQAAARERAAYLAAGSPYGPVQDWGFYGVDSGVMVAGRFVQLEYLDCLDQPHARWYEDGSASC